MVPAEVKLVFSLFYLLKDPLNGPGMTFNTCASLLITNLSLSTSNAFPSAYPQTKVV